MKLASFRHAFNPNRLPIFLILLALLSIVGCSSDVGLSNLETVDVNPPKSLVEPQIDETELPVANDEKMEIEVSPAETVFSSSERHVIAVCPTIFREALKPWVTRRQREGFDVTVIDSQPTAQSLKASLTEIQTTKCQYVLLVGDSQPSPAGEPSDPTRFVPTIYRTADVTAPYQQTPGLPGDLEFGNFDAHNKVQAAVGRLPVKTPAQLSAMLDRIFAFEDSNHHGPWRNRVDLVAGIGGFGPMIDGAIEMVAHGIITGSLPSHIQTRITHASPTSDFHPGVENFTSTVLANYQDGSRFWVYAGHGWVDELDRVPPTQFGRPVLAIDDVPELKQSPQSPPIAVLLACYTGAFDLTEDCLAERMLLAEGGPIAVLAGSRVTMPYGNASMAMGLIQAVYDRKAERLGDAWRIALNEMKTPARANPELASRRMMVDSIASLMGGGSRIDDERREHMQLYNWLGDPTMRLNTEQSLEIDETIELVVDQTTEVKGSSPIGGTLVVELHRRLGGSFSTGTEDENRYLSANRTLIATAKKTIQAGRWNCELELPKATEFPRTETLPVIIKAFVRGDSGHAADSSTTWLRPTATTKSAD